MCAFALGSLHKLSFSDPTITLLLISIIYRICKGPDWKPGIFVQFVREGGIAQEAGLRPGDQILSCNGQDFANISFNEVSCSGYLAQFPFRSYPN